ncbi:hypothetical protein MASR2M18_12150 [Ignavibacteria bacterium]|nr:DUF1232 domain-containing protein [Bacteroidota bacterium]MCZ2133282.1 DUF1232 domain-containing protein [Bacteroidota bacterium]
MANEESDEYIRRVAAELTPADENDIIRRTIRKNRRSAAYAKGLTGRIGLLLDMLRDRNFKFTWSSRAIILAGLAYFVVPTDALPDIIPFVGFVDDAAVIGAVFRRLRNEIERYREFLMQFE